MTKLVLLGALILVGCSTSPTAPPEPTAPEATKRRPAVAAAATYEACRPDDSFPGSAPVGCESECATCSTLDRPSGPVLTYSCLPCDVAPAAFSEACQALKGQRGRWRRCGFRAPR